MRKTILLTLLMVALSVGVFGQDKLEDLAGTYTGNWASDKYDVRGNLVLVVKVTNGAAEVRAVFTGSDYFSEDVFNATFTLLGSGVWQMKYKGKKSKINGTGLFKRGGFVGDYKFRKFIWTDAGKWILEIE